jgi:hypothetical protein
MDNACHFSPCRTYRYSLEHRFDELGWSPRLRLLPWIGLNPSTADERQLDPTLRRIRGFTLKRKSERPYDGFVMLNLFAFRATLPAVMKAAADPIGAENDAIIRRYASAAGCVVAGWGAHGEFLDREQHVVAMLRSLNVEIFCLGRNANGSPKHPLYLPEDSAWMTFIGDGPAASCLRLD